MSGLGVKDVLKNLIALGPVIATLVIVLAAIVGIACALYAAMRLYQSVQDNEPDTFRWFAAFGIASALTCAAIFIGGASLFFTG